jgi:NAD(P)-dependent dehydrogenase (short-subunit alcohol dehydrogenase family)
MSTNLKGRKNCKAVVDNAVKAMGGVDILINNATYQMMANDIKDLCLRVRYLSTSLISPFSTIRYKLVNVFQASPSYNNYKSTANPPICRGQ